MRITNIQVRSITAPNTKSDFRLLAYCSIVIEDSIVIYDLKIISNKGKLFIAMPSRKITDKCKRCNAKNELIAKYCSKCGTVLPTAQAPDGEKIKTHTDIIHPINWDCRKLIHDAIIDAYYAQTKN